MTKYEIVKALAECKPSDVDFLSIVYHNPCDNQGDVIRYSFVYDKFSSNSNINELVKVLLSVYKLRKYVVYVSVVSKTFNAYYDSLDDFYKIYSLSDFIILSTKK